MYADEDLVLMTQIAAGNGEAYRTVLDLYTTPVFQLAYNILRNKEMAEDITQETFIRLWNNASKWRETGRIKSWLFRIAHNLCIDEIRRYKPSGNIDDFSEIIGSDDKLADEEMHESDISKTIKAAVLELPVRQKTALMLVHYSDCSNIEAAEIMEISVDAIESLLSRGRRSLKDKLKDKKEYIWD